MAYCLGFTGQHTGQFPHPATGLAGTTTILDFLAMLLGYCRYHIVVVIGYHLQDPFRTYFDTLLTAITLIGIDANEVLPGTILIAIVGNHFSPSASTIMSPPFQECQPCVLVLLLLLRVLSLAFIAIPAEDELECPQGN